MKAFKSKRELVTQKQLSRKDLQTLNNLDQLVEQNSSGVELKLED